MNQKKLNLVVHKLKIMIRDQQMKYSWHLGISLNKLIFYFPNIREEK